jgi:hypothetical protein
MGEAGMTQRAPVTVGFYKGLQAAFDIVHLMTFELGQRRDNRGQRQGDRPATALRPPATPTLSTDLPP